MTVVLKATAKQNKPRKEINMFLECAFYPPATTSQMPPLPIFSLGFQARLSSPFSFVKLARPLLEYIARCEISLIIICSPQQPDNCSQLHLSVVSSSGRSEEFPSPPGATPPCLCSSPRLLPSCHRGLPC